MTFDAVALALLAAGIAGVILGLWLNRDPEPWEHSHAMPRPRRDPHVATSSKLYDWTEREPQLRLRVVRDEDLAQ